MKYRVFAISLLLSFLLHLVFGLGLAVFESPGQRARQPSLVELIEFPEDQSTADLKMKQFQDKKVFVRQADVPEKELTELDLKARFLSEKVRRVLLETKAKNIGMTKNRLDATEFAQKSLASPERSSTLGEQMRKATLKPNFSPDGTIAIGREQRTGQGYLSQMDLSTVGERLPSDIKTADMTALNSDAYLYYSFYTRLEEIIRPRWIRLTHEAIEKYPVQARRYTRQGELLCAYEFVLDKNGNFLRAIAVTLSGFDAFDTAIVQAFRDAIRIPNPPKDLIQEDGTIRLPLQLSAVLNPIVAERN